MLAEFAFPPHPPTSIALGVGFIYRLIRVWNKQAYDAPVVDTLAKPTPKKRLRGKRPVGAPEGQQSVDAEPPKMAKAKARVKKGGPPAQQFTDTLKKHFRENAGAINLAERVKKRQGKMPAAPKDPVDARDVFSKMPESVRKALHFPAKI